MQWTTRQLIFIWAKNNPKPINHGKYCISEQGNKINSEYSSEKNSVQNALNWISFVLTLTVISSKNLGWLLLNLLCCKHQRKVMNLYFFEQFVMNFLFVLFSFSILKFCYSAVIFRFVQSSANLTFSNGKWIFYEPE